jgi:hypothetical protein
VGQSQMLLENGDRRWNSSAITFTGPRPTFLHPYSTGSLLPHPVHNRQNMLGRRQGGSVKRETRPTCPRRHRHPGPETTTSSYRSQCSSTCSDDEWGLIPGVPRPKHCAFGDVFLTAAESWEVSAPSSQELGEEAALVLRSGQFGNRLMIEIVAAVTIQRRRGVSSSFIVRLQRCAYSLSHPGLLAFGMAASKAMVG